MLTDRSFVLALDADPDALLPLRDELARRLPGTCRADDEVLFVASLLARQAQSWRGASGPVRLRATALGSVVNIEVNRDVAEEGDSGPQSPDGFLGLLEQLADRTERFTVSTFPGCVTLAAQKVVDRDLAEVEIDLRVAA